MPFNFASDWSSKGGAVFLNQSQRSVMHVHKRQFVAKLLCQSNISVPKFFAGVCFCSGRILQILYQLFLDFVTGNHWDPSSSTRPGCTQQVRWTTRQRAGINWPWWRNRRYPISDEGTPVAKEARGGTWLRVNIAWFQNSRKVKE